MQNEKEHALFRTAVLGDPAKEGGALPFLSASSRVGATSLCAPDPRLDPEIENIIEQLDGLIPQIKSKVIYAVLDAKIKAALENQKT